MHSSDVVRALAVTWLSAAPALAQSRERGVDVAVQSHDAAPGRR
jgi:hypothetical protein